MDKEKKRLSNKKYTSKPGIKEKIKEYYKEYRRKKELMKLQNKGNKDW